jgi:hypothetical protein
MTALEEPYEYVQCTKKKNRSDGVTLNEPHLRSVLRTRENGSGSRKLMPRSREENDYQDDKNNGNEECITLILCDHGDEFNHWTDDCNGRYNIVS